MIEPGLDWKPRMVSVTSDGLGARVVLDDVDITRHVQGYTIEQRSGQPPIVVLHAQPNGGAAFEGMAHVALVTAPDMGQAVADFLRGINPAALDAAAIERDLDGSSNELTKAMLEQLIEWALGQGRP